MTTSYLGIKTGAEIVARVGAIPASVTSLDLSRNSLCRKTGAELAALVGAIPASVTSLDLNRNFLGDKPGDELVALVAAIPANLTSLDLSGNVLGNKPGDELVALVAAIPASLTSLNLSGNFLGNMTGDELVALVAAIPASLTSLNLSVNDLGEKTGAELIALVTAIPASVTSLDLSLNYLDSKTGAELEAIMAAIPASLTSLNLSMNDLGEKTGAELAALVAAIPASVTSLNLSRNDLYRKTGAELAEVFAALPAALTTLNLSDNELNAEQLDAILKALPVGVESIILDDKTINRNDEWAEHLLVDVAKLTANEGMARFAFETIEPPIEIDGKRLNRLIDFLEKQNNPIADLTCGLLLEGQIETTTDILENCSEYDEHRERRNHDGISFYSKAANDATIRPIAEFLLWHMKTTSPFKSIQNRLAQYDLAPKAAYIINSFNQAAHNRKGISTPILTNLGLFKSMPEKLEAGELAPAPRDETSDWVKKNGSSQDKPQQSTIDSKTEEELCKWSL